MAKDLMDFMLPPAPTGNSGVQRYTGSTVKEIAENASVEVIHELIRIGLGEVGDASVSARLIALKEVLDRGLGKAVQQIEHKAGHDEVIRQLRQAMVVDVSAEVIEDE